MYLAGIVHCSNGMVVDTGNAVITNGNLLMPETTATIGQIQFGTIPFIHDFGGANANIFIGKNAGNFTMDNTGTAGATNNIGLGTSSLASTAKAYENTAIGYQALHALVGAFPVTDNAHKNVVVGNSAASQLVSGSANIILGWGAAYNFTTVESSNIIIGSLGTILDANTIRIGSQGNAEGQQNLTYIAGIYGSTPAAATTAITLVDSTGKLGSAALATNGQILIGSTGAAPVIANIIQGLGITITNGAGTIRLDTPALFYQEATATPTAMTAGIGYIANYATLLTFTLPALANEGQKISIIGKGAGGYTITQAAGQQVFFGSQNTTLGVGGSLATTTQYCCIDLICIVANNTWVVCSSVGNFVIV
jgi:hypothetical protein